MKNLAILISLALLAVGISGCQNPMDSLARWALQLSSKSAPDIQGSASQATPEHTLQPSEAAEQAKQNAELLQEVMRVVYDRDPSNRAEFGSLVDSMNQGASIEGLYNGFTHSSEYRKLEVENPGSSRAALRFFASELARTEAELKPPTVFGPESARPLAVPEAPGDSSAGDASAGSPGNPGVTEVEFGKAAESAPTGDEAKYMRIFSGASIFTLKRVLGDEMLRLIAQKLKDPKALRDWYGKWAARMCGENVDFGLPQRNLTDAAFHSKWAASADHDRLIWEVLNRVHRVLNAKNLERKGS